MCSEGPLEAWIVMIWTGLHLRKASRKKQQSTIIHLLASLLFNGTCFWLIAIQIGARLHRLVSLWAQLAFASTGFTTSKWWYIMIFTFWTTTHASMRSLWRLSDWSHLDFFLSKRKPFSIYPKSIPVSVRLTPLDWTCNWWQSIRGVYTQQTSISIQLINSSFESNRTILRWNVCR